MRHARPSPAGRARRLPWALVARTSDLRRGGWLGCGGAEGSGDPLMTFATRLRVSTLQRLLSVDSDRRTDAVCHQTVARFGGCLGLVQCPIAQTSVYIFVFAFM